MAISTEVLAIPRPSTALDSTNSSVSTTASEVELEISHPSPSLSINNTANEALDDLADLPPLPSLTHDEIEDLDPTYPDYRATIHYYTLSPSGTLTQETHPTPVSRTSVLLSLEYFYTLREHLTASISILETYPGTSLVGVNDTEATPSNVPWEDTVTGVVAPNAHTQSDSRRDSRSEREALDTTIRKSPSFTELERVQNEFAMHHIAINENLRAANSGWACQSFGLPDPMGAASDIRHDRNYFAHIFPTPTGKGIQFEWAVKRKAEEYGKLLGFVEDGICVLQAQLDDPGIWVSLESIERERVEREAREEEERLGREGAEQDDDEEGVYEQEDDVECIEPTQSTFSRVFNGLGGNAVARYCFLFGVVRNAGSRLWAWLGEMLEEADAVALRRAGEGVPGDCGEGDDWASREDRIGDDECRSQEYKTEDGDCRSQEYEVGDDECHGSRTLDAQPSRPDSGWGDPQW
ncbi:hypothetical protein J4E83_004303 [Alternaria metachromatica]|uniref:uncharacterized protein n=1 Tax=Alternaria metachromatica TaxID=283354 RepID=UPI0020C1FDCD|nr:uncharacterized protein J4E83_004303 [Alternaria metachromatica]KAI4624627.1 hypothetical protein J4E83_004303 [Alternaria metachromatica]